MIADLVNNADLAEAVTELHLPTAKRTYEDAVGLAQHATRSYEHLLWTQKLMPRL